MRETIQRQVYDLMYKWRMLETMALELCAENVGDACLRYYYD